MTDKRREIIVPGEVIGKGEELLPGDWTMRQGDNIIAVRMGVLDKSERLVKIIPISGVYIPRRGNVVIAEIKEITMNGWISDIGAPYSSFISLRECPMYIREDEMDSVYGIGELVIAKILDVKRNGIDLTIKGRGLGKIKDGLILKINPHKVPRVIGKEGSMVNIIKQESNCEIVVGQNGLIWIKGEDIEKEIFAKKAIEFINENTIIEGLTEKAEEWLKENKPKEKK